MLWVLLTALAGEGPRVTVGSALQIGWQPLIASVDGGLSRIGPTTLGVGVEGAVATQLLANARLAALRAVDTPPLRAPEGAAFRWRLVDRSAGLRVLLHLDRLEGRPFLLAGLTGHLPWVRAISRDDEGVRGVWRGRFLSGFVGVGVTAASARGWLVAAEVRYAHRLVGSNAGPVPLADGGETDVPRFMRAPPWGLMRFSVGRRWSGLPGRRSAHEGDDAEHHQDDRVHEHDARDEPGQEPHDGDADHQDPAEHLGWRAP